MPDYITLWHKECGGRAFLLRPEAGEQCTRMRSADALHIDGSKIQPVSTVVCDTCNEPINPNSLSPYRVISRGTQHAAR